MSTLATVLLVILAIVVVIGLIRVIITPSDNLLDFVMDIFLIDLLCDLLGGIFEAIGDIWD